MTYVISLMIMGIIALLVPFFIFKDKEPKHQK